MNKGLEVLIEDFKIIKFKTINAGYDYGYEVWDKIEQALLELKTIKESNPSEAMKCFDTIKEENCCEDNSIGVIYYDECNTIKQALIKSQEFENVLKKYNIENIEELEKILKIFFMKG